MAINTKEFINKVDIGLKANSDYTRFYYRFKLEYKITHGIFDYSSQSWDKKTTIAKAKADLLAKKEHRTGIADVGFNESSTLDTVAKLYFALKCEDTRSNVAKRENYNTYLGDIRTSAEIEDYKSGKKFEKGLVFNNAQYKLGKKKIKDIKTLHIDIINNAMGKAGVSKQTSKGCSPATIRKTLLQTLKPIMQYAVDNDVISKVPKINTPKLVAKKKIVNNPQETLVLLFNTISILYKDDAFYRALFMFALYGRRLNEILTIEWSDINLDAAYTIREENSKTTEKNYTLPPVIAEALATITADREGLIFKSPKTGKKLFPPKRQLARVVKASGVLDLTFHKFRHILVSAMTDGGAIASVVSASLGHNNSRTTEKHYITQNNLKASAEANKAIEGLVS